MSGMRRREFITLLGGVAVGWPISAQAQSSTIRRIGWISVAAPEDAETSPYFEEFRAGLRDLGYVEGRNITIDARWARGDPDRGLELAKDLVQRGVAAIVTQGAAIRVVRRAEARIRRP